WIGLSPFRRGLVGPGHDGFECQMRLRILNLHDVEHIEMVGIIDGPARSLKCAKSLTALQAIDGCALKSVLLRSGVRVEINLKRGTVRAADCRFAIPSRHLRCHGRNIVALAKID